MPQSTKLTTPQKRWCEAVNRGTNGTKAVREIWPRITAPEQKAYVLRKLPQVQAYLAQLDANAMEQAGITRTFILEQLKAVAGFDPRKLFKPDGELKSLNELDEETAFALSSIEHEYEIDVSSRHQGTRVRKFKAWSKTEALRVLAQIRGMMKNELEVSGGGVMVRVVDLTGAKKPESRNG